MRSLPERQKPQKPTPASSSCLKYITLYSPYFITRTKLLYMLSIIVILNCKYTILSKDFCYWLLTCKKSPVGVFYLVSTKEWMWQKNTHTFAENAESFYESQMTKKLEVLLTDSLKFRFSLNSFVIWSEFLKENNWVRYVWKLDRMWFWIFPQNQAEFEFAAVSSRKSHRNRKIWN